MTPSQTFDVSSSPEPTPIDMEAARMILHLFNVDPKTGFDALSHICVAARVYNTVRGPDADS